MRPQRPTTAESGSTVAMLRTGIEAQRVTMAMQIPLGVNHESLQLITTNHARALITARRTEITKDLECWVAGNEPAHENGYKAVNLANTKSQADGAGDVKIGLRKVYLHHLALIADDRRDELGWCTQANNLFQVSHLCHNGGCFNPAHLKVEESWRNKQRNSCQGHEILSYSGWGPLKYHPCSHGGELNEFHRCLLPTRFITESGSYRNSSM